jgi:titin
VGVLIGGGAHDNLVGSLTGTSVTQGGNLISGNGGTGLSLDNADNNHISGNIIGLNANGTAAVPNLTGILIHGSQNVVGIGPSGEGYRNLVSGNENDGLSLQGSDSNRIAGNFIGTNLNGTAAIPNRNGIYLTAGSSSNTIGTNGDGVSDTEEGNLVSGNLETGVWIAGNTSSNNGISGNLIGTNLAGTAALGNGLAGISSAGSFTLIGTDGDGVSDALEGNVVSGNGTVGVDLYGSNNLVAGNFIGTNRAGTNPLGNAFEGVLLHAASHDNLIGTNGDGVSDAEERNLISGNGLAMNGDAGIVIEGDDNIVAGNDIGTDVSGTIGIGNLQEGIILNSTASNNLIGTNGDGSGDASEGNLVSGNGWMGIWLHGASFNTIAGNIVGTDISGTAAIANGHAINENTGAINLSGGASGNRIGTNSDGSQDTLEGNLISGNNLNGVVLWDAATHSNTISGNKIGTDLSGTSALGNNGGISLFNGPTSNRIGTDGNGSSDIAERNIISGNSGMGIYLQGAQTTIAGNYIGTDAGGTGDLGNGERGIYVADGSLLNTIGGSPAKANLIAFNGRHGIYVTGAGLNRVTISANSIHSNDESGIDLQDESGQGLWFSPNDVEDVDSGPNDMMNFPVLTGATLLSPTLAITGQIVDGLPNTAFHVEFFANDSCDTPGEHGEGQTYLGFAQVSTDGSGNADFLKTMQGSFQPGSFITSTATNSGKTSEFSACVEAAEAVNYSQALDGDRCDLFGPEPITVVTSEVNRDRLYLYLYAHRASGYPGLDFEVPDDTDEWLYRAMLGEAESLQCGLQGIAGRLYCGFNIPAGYLQTSQDLKLFVNNCTPPIYVVEDVFIFEEPKAPESQCTSGLNQNACVAAGGSYDCSVVGAPCTCDCP